MGNDFYLKNIEYIIQYMYKIVDSNIIIYFQFEIYIYFVSFNFFNNFIFSYNIFLS